jgi:hypothetical protein
LECVGSSRTSVAFQEPALFHRYEAVSNGNQDQPRDFANGEPLHDLGAVNGDGVDAETERGGDLTTRASAGKERKHFTLASRELLIRCVVHRWRR